MKPYDYSPEGIARAAKHMRSFPSRYGADLTFRDLALIAWVLKWRAQRPAPSQPNNEVSVPPADQPGIDGPHCKVDGADPSLTVGSGPYPLVEPAQAETNFGLGDILLILQSAQSALLDSSALVSILREVDGVALVAGSCTGGAAAKLTFSSVSGWSSDFAVEMDLLCRKEQRRLQEPSAEMIKQEVEAFLKHAVGVTLVHSRELR